ncbi:MAG: glycoside hydrolase family 3 C-terminal domain-containing protein [Treponema sp.]|nr:glycoside hydrolase family 3 C-terminal domain-containing protein [Treponema sp.]
MKTVRTKARASKEVSALEAKNRLLSREVAAEGIVLLQNEDVLPLAPGKIALFGAGARNTIKGGTGSGEVNERYSVSIEQGLKDAGFTIADSAWLNDYEKQLMAEKAVFNKNIGTKMVIGSSDERINIMANPFQYPCGREIIESDVSDRAEVCMYVLARQAGECSERRLSEYVIRQGEIDHLRFLSSRFSKIIFVVNCSAPMDISALDSIKNISAIVLFGQQGMEGGNALADLITGKFAPSGCLSSTWAKQYEDLPNAMEYSHLKGHTDYEEYKEGLYVGYRYFDSFDKEPRYPFGYGLTYSTFEIKFIRASITKTKVSVSIKVQNTGIHNGKKVVQLYVSAPSWKLEREYQSLAAFGKTKALGSGEQEELSLTFDLKDLAGYDEESSSWILEKGDYIVRVGENSKNTKPALIITIEENITTEVCKNLCVNKKPFDEIRPNEKRKERIPEGIQKLKVNPADFQTLKHDYNAPEKPFSESTIKILDKLTKEDLFKVVCGSGIWDTNPYYSVPGAAAYTTSDFVKHGLPNAALCDGPAGVRLQRTSVRYKNGKVKPVDAMMELMASMPKILRMFIYGNPKKGELLYQFATMFPVGTSMAQTWNSELVEHIGKAKGEEMQEYGATWLLAPSINIHRNPLCGRNYEYLSEDPVLSGKIGAAITRGVQSLKGCYVTVKHYAANNQETNRNKSDSRVSERVLREIYLKAFGITIKESGAKAIMTSYNLLNGTYTPNNYDLCTAILRKEWGFDGVVMTDWFSTGKGLAGNGSAIAAGNDLMMPGGKEYINMLRKDLEAGVYTIEQLRLCAGRVVESILQSGKGLAT